MSGLPSPALPQALMGAGASVSLYAKFAGISAGLGFYIDVLITVGSLLPSWPASCHRVVRVLGPA